MLIVPYVPGIPVTTRQKVAHRMGVRLPLVNKWIESGELTLVARLAGVRAVILESSVDALLERMNAVANAE